VTAACSSLASSSAFSALDFYSLAAASFFCAAAFCSLAWSTSFSAFADDYFALA